MKEVTAPDLLRLEAERLLANKFLPVVLDKAKSDIFMKWRITRDAPGRDALWYELDALERLAGAIESECRDAIRNSGDPDDYAE